MRCSHRIILFALLVAAGATPLPAQDLRAPTNLNVQPVESDEKPSRRATLKTPWGMELSPDEVHPDYPRPTLVRKSWLNLNGSWDWKELDRVVALPADREPRSYDARILVPFPVEAALSGVARSTRRMVYRRFFTIPEDWPADHRVILHFGAVDWEATVFVNGRAVGTHRGGYDPFSFDITDHLAAAKDGVSELVVRVYDPTNHGLQPRGKQSTTPSGIWYTPVSGIWQTVWLEPVAPSHLKTVRYSADLESAVLTIQAQVENARQDLSLFVEAFDGDQVVAKAYGGVDGPLLLRFSKKSLKTWSPESPHLYQLRIRLLDKDIPIDQAGSYAAFRSIDLARNALGKTRIRLNGRFQFLLGVLDQGYWPDGLYTAPSDRAIRTEIEVARRFGFNLIRKHVKVEPERWYFWCDRLGMLVWQDMPSGDNRTPEAREQFQRELESMVRTRSNHPSIIIWTLFNEGWGQHKTAEYVDLLRRLDPSRLIDNASGWTDYGVGHLSDHHRFPGPEAPPPDPIRAAVIGSFGGLTLVPPESNLWTSETWGYQHVADSDALLRAYRAMHQRLRRQIREDGLSAAVFHQLVDVESECNGLVTYDRRLLKIPAEEFHQINQTTIAYGSAPP